MRRLLLLFVGGYSYAYWIVADPSREATATQDEWPNVLYFSSFLLVMGLGVLAFGRQHEGPYGGRGIHRATTVAAGALVANSCVNIVEDGLGVDDAFLVFVAMLGIAHLALIALTIGLLRRRKLLAAAVPLLVVATIVFFVEAGGALSVVTWLLAALVVPKPHPLTVD